MCHSDAFYASRVFQAWCQVCFMSSLISSGIHYMYARERSLLRHRYMYVQVHTILTSRFSIFILVNIGQL